MSNLEREYYIKIQRGIYKRPEGCKLSFYHYWLTLDSRVMADHLQDVISAADRFMEHADKMTRKVNDVCRESRRLTKEIKTLKEELEQAREQLGKVDELKKWQSKADSILENVYYWETCPEDMEGEIKKLIRMIPGREGFK